MHTAAAFLIEAVAACPAAGWGEPAVTVASARWYEAHEALRTLGQVRLEVVAAWQLSTADYAIASRTMATPANRADEAGEWCWITTITREAVASLAPLYPSARWYEREITDLFGPIIVGVNDPLLTTHDSPPLARSAAFTRRDRTPWPGLFPADRAHAGGRRRARPLGTGRDRGRDT